MFASLVTGILVATILRSTSASALAGIAAGAIGAGLLTAATVDPAGLLTIRGMNGWQVLLCGSLATPMAATTACWVAQHRLRGWPTDRIVGLTLVVAVAVWFVVSTTLAAAPQSPRYNEIAASGSFSADSDIFLQTYRYMKAGDGYYDALVMAAADDARLQQEGAIENGLFVDWAPTRALVREPGVFYLWTLIAPSGGGILVASILGAGLVMVALYLALLPHWGLRALFVPIVLMPLLSEHATAPNTFMPDWWATLAIALSIACVLRDRVVCGLVLALAAALFREVAVVWLALLILAVLIGWVKTRALEQSRWALVAGVCVIAFAGAMAWHYHSATAIIANHTAAGLGVVDLAKESAARSFGERFLAPASYLMGPYEFWGALRSAFLLPIGLLGLLLIGRAVSARGRWLPAIYLGAWMALTAVVGAHSYYWGQYYTLIAVAGCGVVLAEVGRRLHEASSRPVLGTVQPQ